jgi:hypothetical protein
MDDSGSVRRHDCAAHLPHQRERLRGSESRPLDRFLAQRASLEELHDEVGAAALGHAVIMHCHDVRVAQPCHGDRLAAKAFVCHPLREQLAQDHLQRDRSLVGCQERLNLTPNGRVALTGPVEACLPLVPCVVERSLENFAYSLPVRRHHPDSVSSIRRRSHARAVAHARSTVRGEVTNTSATSSTVNPPK